MNDCGIRFLLLLSGMLANAALAPAASADDVIYRFKAELKRVQISPPSDSMTAKAASARTLTGTFGYAMDVPVAAKAGIPGRVAFAEYDTGFIAIDQLDLGALPGAAVTRVTDGARRADAPGQSIGDEVAISRRALSVDAAVDSISLRIRYGGADELEGVSPPETLEGYDIHSIELIFSTRIDGLTNARQAQSRRAQVLGLANFEITRLQRVE